MKTVYLVDADQPPTGSTYPSYYFPRKFHYKADAKSLVTALKQQNFQNIRLVTLFSKGRKEEKF